MADGGSVTVVLESLIHVYELLALHSSGKCGESRSDNSRGSSYSMGQHEHKQAMYNSMNNSNVYAKSWSPPRRQAEMPGDMTGAVFRARSKS